VASRCLQLAGKIEASKNVDRLLAESRGLEPKEGAQSSAEAAPVLEPSARTKKIKPSPSASLSPKQLESRLRDEIAREDLQQGYATLASLQKVSETPELCGEYRNQLDRIRERLIAAYLDDAAAHYRGGRITRARETWLKVLELDPDNQTARDKIARADRVLKKLHDLQESQQKPNSPK